MSNIKKLTASPEFHQWVANTAAELAEDVGTKRMPDCADLDEDCPGVEDKAHCWLYAPERGMCPYLRRPTNGA